MSCAEEGEQHVKLGVLCMIGHRMTCWSLVILKDETEVVMNIFFCMVTNVSEKDYWGKKYGGDLVLCISCWLDLEMGVELKNGGRWCQKKIFFSILWLVTEVIFSNTKHIYLKHRTWSSFLKHLDGMQLNKIENKMLKCVSKSISAHVFVHVGNPMQIKPMMCEWDDRARWQSADAVISMLSSALSIWTQSMSLNITTHLAASPSPTSQWWSDGKMKPPPPPPLPSFLYRLYHLSFGCNQHSPLRSWNILEILEN